jgi:hypothetical protein
MLAAEMGWRVRRSILPGVLVAVVAVAGCKLFKRPAAGDPCTDEGQTTCDTAKAALLCRKGKLVTLPCNGTSGCKSTEPPLCDDNVATVGDNCVEGTGGSLNMACTPDSATMLVCKGGTFGVGALCRGKGACKATSALTSNGGSTSMSSDVVCDDTIAQAGDPCVTPDHTACSVDATMTVTCKGGTMVPRLGCRGPGGCVIKAGDKPDSYGWDCDDSVSRAGDPCEDEGRHTCSVDGSMWLVCKSNMIVADNACRGPKGCTTTPDPDKPGSQKETCDDSLAMLDDPCEPDEEYACSTDGKMLLQCKGAKYAVSKPCAHGCRATPEPGGHRLYCD